MLARLAGVLHLPYYDVSFCCWASSPNSISLEMAVAPDFTSISYLFCTSSSSLIFWLYWGLLLAYSSNLDYFSGYYGAGTLAPNFKTPASSLDFGSLFTFTDTGSGMSGFFSAWGSNWLKKSSASKLMSNFLAFKFCGCYWFLPRNRLPKFSFNSFYLFAELVELVCLTTAAGYTTGFFTYKPPSVLGCNPLKSNMSDSSTKVLGFLGAATSTFLGSSATGAVVGAADTFAWLPPIIIMFDFGCDSG